LVAVVRDGCFWVHIGLVAGDAPALITDGGEAISRQRLGRCVRSVGGHLTSQGIGRTDRLALVMAAAATAPLSPSSPAGVFEEDLRRLRVTWVLVDDDPPAALLEAAHRLGLPLVRLNPLELPEAPAPLLPLPAPSDLALLLQTSGTTSRPKLVPLSHANLLVSAHAVAEVLSQPVPSLNVNFFQIGGDSLTGMRVICRLAAHLGLDLQPTLLFHHPCVRTLGERLDQQLEATLAQLQDAR